MEKFERVARLAKLEEKKKGQRRKSSTLREDRSTTVDIGDEALASPSSHTQERFAGDNLEEKGGSIRLKGIEHL